MAPGRRRPAGWPRKHTGNALSDGSTLDIRAHPATTGHRDAPPSAWLMVFEGDSSRLVPLPSQGEVVLGRGDGCQVILAEPGVSRQHARIWLDRGQARVSDLGSQNGTRVNDEPVVGSVPLHSGDELNLSGVTVVFHASAGAGRQDGLLESAAFRGRLESELERALRYVRPVTVGTVLFGGKVDRAALRLALEPALRRIEAVSPSGDDALLWLLPEGGADEVQERAAAVLTACQTLRPTARLGLATAPDDGIDADTLLAASREAARAAGSAAVQQARDTFKELKLGDQRVWIADAVMVRLYALIERLAASDLPVLVMGETGAGKELAATAVHHFSPRREQRQVTLNCAALQETLVESELFGHERGAFTGAVASRVGVLEAAAGGTVFLDELGELSLTVQAKLLRALETKRITRVGDTREREVDFRVVAATNRNLEQEVKAGRFREDLFFRLSGATLWLPPLRARKRELLILARAFLERACTKAARTPLELSAPAVQLLAQHSWPGNVRELRNVMEYAAATISEERVEPWHLHERLSAPSRPADGPTPVPPPAEASASFRPLPEEVRELERTRMLQALTLHGWNQTRASQALGMPLRTFVTKMGQYDLRAARDR